MFFCILLKLREVKWPCLFPFSFLTVQLFCFSLTFVLFYLLLLKFASDSLSFLFILGILNSLRSIRILWWRVRNTKSHLLLHSDCYFLCDSSWIFSCAHGICIVYRRLEQHLTILCWNQDGSIDHRELWHFE